MPGCPSVQYCLVVVICHAGSLTESCRCAWSSLQRNRLFTGTMLSFAFKFSAYCYLFNCYLLPVNWHLHCSSLCNKLWVPEAQWKKLCLRMFLGRSRSTFRFLPLGDVFLYVYLIWTWPKGSAYLETSTRRIKEEKMSMQWLWHSFTGGLLCIFQEIHWKRARKHLFDK